MTTALLAAGFLVAIAGTVASWVAGTVPSRPANVLARVAWAMLAIAAALWLLAGIVTLSLGEPSDLAVPGASGGSHLGLDSISALFLVITFGVAVPALTAALARAGRHRVRLPAAIGIAAISSAVVITARDLFPLYAGWEGVGIAFYLIVGFDRREKAHRTAAVLAASFSKVSGAALLLGGAAAAASGGGTSFAALASANGALRDIAYTAFVIAFAIKVGLLPFHPWLPRAYMSAPPTVRALLAGVVVNVGFYGLWRTLDLFGSPPVWLACTLVVLAGSTALLGIAHGAVHPRLPGLIAWSSVENAGLILVGFALALIGADAHIPAITAVGLLAATAQVITHALGKSLLFVAASEIQSNAVSDRLDDITGAARQHPVAAIGITIASFTMAGLPLTVGFVSEWLILEALMQEFRIHDLVENLALAAAGALVALTTGIAAVAFVRLVGLTVFGRTRPPVEQARRSVTLSVSILLLAAACLALAVVAPLEMQAIGAGLQQVTGSRTASAVTDGVILQPVYSGFSALSPSLLWIVLPAYALGTFAVIAALPGHRVLRVRRVTPWRSASPGVAGGNGYTSFAFANPLRRVFASLLGTRHDLVRQRPTDDSKPDTERDIGYVVEVSDIVERYVYRPALPALAAIVAQAKRLQSGRLDAYMAYMLVALLAVLGVVAVLALHA